MDSHDRFWTYTIFYIIFGICVLTFMVSNVTLKINKAAFENGYEKQILIGYSVPQWTKVRK